MANFNRMMMAKELNAAVKEFLQEGTVIPAHPLALNQQRRMDETRQRTLTRYYMAAGVGGVAVGVHTTQFEIRDPAIGLLEPVLRLAAEEIAEAALNRPFVKVAGIVGPTDQALKEADLALQYGYDLGLVSMGGLRGWSEAQIIQRIYAISEVIPVFGFYLQPAVGGRIFSYEFWQDFAEIPNVHAIKVASFNRYLTLDVVRAVCNSSRSGDIALYTGNDDNIVADLLTPYRFTVNGKVIEKRFVGGLLGHWAVWTSKAVALLAEIKQCLNKHDEGLGRLLSQGVEITDMNAVIFDAQHAFKGCIPGIHEVLRRQGLLEGTWCLREDEVLAAGQLEEIDRLYSDYPHQTDDAFVRNFLQQEKQRVNFPG